MAKLPATRQNLKTAFQKHKACYEFMQNHHDRSRRLVLFYAVESGLKVYLLDKIHKHSIEDLFQHQGYSYLQDNGHDIIKMLKSANLSGQYRLKVLHGDKNIQVEPHQYHQFWRYGLNSKNETEEQEVEKTLYHIAEFLSQNLTKKQIRRV